MNNFSEHWDDLVGRFGLDNVEFGNIIVPLTDTCNNAEFLNDVSSKFRSVDIFFQK